MTNGEKLNEVFGMSKEIGLRTCMRPLFEPDSDLIECLGKPCSKCEYSYGIWSKKEYKEPKVVEKKITKNFYTLEDAISYLQEHKISDENFVSFQKLELCTYTTIRGCWELVYRDKVYIPTKSEDKK